MGFMLPIANSWDIKLKDDHNNVLCDIPNKYIH